MKSSPSSSCNTGCNDEGNDCGDFCLFGRAGPFVADGRRLRGIDHLAQPFSPAVPLGRERSTMFKEKEIIIRMGVSTAVLKLEERGRYVISPTATRLVVHVLHRLPPRRSRYYTTRASFSLRNVVLPGI